MCFFSGSLITLFSRHQEFETDVKSLKPLRTDTETGGCEFSNNSVFKTPRLWCWNCDAKSKPLWTLKPADVFFLRFLNNSVSRHQEAETDAKSKPATLNTETGCGLSQLLSHSVFKTPSCWNWHQIRGKPLREQTGCRFSQFLSHSVF